jgi:hypothetical protein
VVEVIDHDVSSNLLDKRRGRAATPASASRTLSKRARDLEAADVGQADIEKHDVRRAVRGCSQRGCAIVRKRWGQFASGPSGVTDQSMARINAPISPPPSSQLKSSVIVSSGLGRVIVSQVANNNPVL